MTRAVDFGKLYEIIEPLYSADREAHGKEPFDDDDPPKPAGKKWDNTSKKKLARRKKVGFKTVTKSTTDPDCGMFVKGEHLRQFAYEAHTALRHIWKDYEGLADDARDIPGPLRKAQRNH